MSKLVTLYQFYEVETEPEFDSDKDLNGYFPETLQTYFEVDKCLLTFPSLTEKEILNSARKTEDQDQGDDEDKTDKLEATPSIEEALEAAKLLK